MRAHCELRALDAEFNTKTQRSQRDLSSRGARQYSSSCPLCLCVESNLAACDWRKERHFVVRADGGFEAHMLLIDGGAQAREIAKGLGKAAAAGAQEFRKLAHVRHAFGQIQAFFAHSSFLSHPREVKEVHAPFSRRVWARPACR